MNDQNNEATNTANVRNRAPQQQYPCGKNSSSENEGDNDNDNIKVAMYSYLGSKEVKRWDLLYLWYLLSICLTGILFGSAVKGKFTQLIMFSFFTHISAELCLVWHFLFSSKVAYYLCIGTCTVFLGQGFILVPMIPDVDFLVSISAIQAVFSDTMSVTSTISILLNKQISNQFRIFSTCILVHFIGFSILMISFFDIWYISGDAPKGKGWVLFSIMSIIQTYYGRNVLQSKLNFQQHQPNSKSTKAQIICFIVTIFTCIMFFLGNKYRTIPTEKNTNPGVLGTGVYKTYLSVAGYPIAMLLAILSLYFWTKGRAQIDEKLNGVDNTQEKNANVQIKETSVERLQPIINPQGQPNENYGNTSIQISVCDEYS